MIERIQQAHALYCRLTGQRVSLRFDRERMWFELLRAGFTEADVQSVIRYLQREIRHGRRNVGALKLSNLIQRDRFEEDLNNRLGALMENPWQGGPPTSTSSVPRRRPRRLRTVAGSTPATWRVSAQASG